MLIAGLRSVTRLLLISLTCYATGNALLLLQLRLDAIHACFVVPTMENVATSRIVVASVIQLEAVQ